MRKVLLWGMQLTSSKV
ncbi:unnamed protein product [Callosobruchus maculatus]|uniref:Uncharacterized protein n=1 Tax=Callosobruchus maculatus TaxID=64391 RepID=A0A653CVN8_CALMS|nr:unnamed protein product [Callosobruchus maculatus]